MNQDGDDKTLYQVVVNSEEQYSIWPADKPLPGGWSAAGKRGSRAECLAYIKEAWLDMRPRGLRSRVHVAWQERADETST